MEKSQIRRITKICSNGKSIGVGENFVGLAYKKLYNLYIDHKAAEDAGHTCKVYVESPNGGGLMRVSVE